MNAGTNEIRLRQSRDGSLLLNHDGKEMPVNVRGCFPWREPRRFLSLCDKEGKEVALINDPSQLDAASRAILEQALAVAGFTLRIDRILDIEDEIELRTWKVEVSGVARSFQTELDAWPHALPGGGLLIRDVSGDLYTLDDPARLDANGRRLLWALSG